MCNDALPQASSVFNVSSDQTLFEYRAAEGSADERCHHRLSQCRAPLSPNQMIAELCAEVGDGMKG
jgi:hypothetical protein